MPPLKPDPAAGELADPIPVISPADPPLRSGGGGPREAWWRGPKSGPEGNHGGGKAPHSQDKSDKDAPSKRPVPVEPWLTVVGIGEDGVAGLGERTKAAIARAEHVFGGERHLALAEGLIRGTARAWPKPFDSSMAAVRALRGSRVAVLASGDPFLFGVGAALARHVPPEEMLVLPAPSAFSLAAARMGWALQDVECVSLHGKPVATLRPLLHPGRHVLALTSDEAGPAAVAALLVVHGFGPSRMTVLEALGGPRERISTQAADAFEDRGFDPLNLVAVEVAGRGPAMPLAPGLPDAFFRHDGQITKPPARALTLAALAPRRGELLWDVGAGAGSIAAEWMLRDPSLRAIAIEARSDRAENIRENARALGVPGLQVMVGRAPEAFENLPAPDAVFVGGGGAREGVMPAVMAALRPGGRLVANAVTLEMEAVLLALHQRHGGELLRFALARAEGVGGMTGWRPSMPLTQWTWVKP